MSMKSVFFVAIAALGIVGCDGVGAGHAPDVKSRELIAEESLTEGGLTEGGLTEGGLTEAGLTEGEPGPTNCQSNQDCGPGGRCFAGSCSPGACDDDEDCAQGESCEYLSWPDSLDGFAWCVPQASIAKCEYRKATSCVYVKGKNGGGGCSATYTDVLHNNHGDGCGVQHSATDCDMTACSLKAANLWCYAKP